MDFRHEWKHEIEYSDMLCLRKRLSVIMQQDSHAIDGSYTVRSLYFDSITDKALREKLNGVDRREKFRIRCYNGDLSYILLEKKSKINGLCTKRQERLTLSETEKIVCGDLKEVPKTEKPLLFELYLKMTLQGLKPKTIVDYTREPFVWGPGNVRVTLDHSIRTGMLCTDFFNADCVTVPVKDMPIILEVKWDGFLPSVIRDAVQLPRTRTAAFSKYAACRVFG